MPPRRHGTLPLDGQLTAASVASAPPPGALDRAGAVRALLRFSLLLVGSALVLQRFALPAGAKAINIVGFIGIGYALWGLLRGTLTFSIPRLAAFLALCFCAICGMIFHAVVPDSFSASPELQSLLQFLIMTGFAVLSFAVPVPEEDFFRIVSACLGFIAIAGLLEFLLQFGGLRLFSFRGLVPNTFLFEDGYNVVIPFGVGSLYKSNGFFLLEPSIFSQFMALGFAVEILTRRRLQLLALFGIGLMISGSGTGWIVLGAFILTTVFSLGRRGVLIAAGTVAVVGLAILAAWQFAPDIIASMSDRMNEFTQQGTSGQLRFITPFWVAQDVLAREPLVGLLGLGAGVSERLTTTYQYNVNTPVKIALEYGFPGLIAYLALFLSGRRTRIQWTLTVPCLVLLLFTGGYQQFPPILFPVLLITAVARLEPSGGVRVARAMPTGPS